MQATDVTMPRLSYMTSREFKSLILGDKVWVNLGNYYSGTYGLQAGVVTDFDFAGNVVTITGEKPFAYGGENYVTVRVKSPHSDKLPYSPYPLGSRGNNPDIALFSAEGVVIYEQKQKRYAERVAIRNRIVTALRKRSTTNALSFDALAKIEEVIAIDLLVR